MFQAPSETDAIITFSITDRRPLVRRLPTPAPAGLRYPAPAGLSYSSQMYVAGSPSTVRYCITRRELVARCEIQNLFFVTPWPHIEAASKDGPPARRSREAWRGLFPGGREAFFFRQRVTPRREQPPRQLVRRLPDTFWRHTCLAIWLTAYTCPKEHVGAGRWRPKEHVGAGRWFWASISEVKVLLHGRP